jgi:plasmid stability protein
LSNTDSRRVILEYAIPMLVSLIVANRRADRAETLREASGRLDALRITLRLGPHLGFASNGGYDDLAGGGPLAGALAPWHKGSMAKSLPVGKAARSRISVDLPPAVRRRLRVVAARHDVSLQEYVRRAVEQQLAEDAPAGLRAEDDPVLAELWSNEADAIYDEL